MERNRVIKECKEVKERDRVIILISVTSHLRSRR